MSAPRFSDYRTIVKSKYGGVATCGHIVNVGDRIGWAKWHGKAYTQCSNCWAKWEAENAEADAIEQGYLPQCL